MTNFRIRVLLLSSAALALAACSSSTSGQGSAASGSAGGGSRSVASGAASSPAASASAGAGSSSSGPTNPETLASRLQQGLTETSSAHIDLRITTAGKVITGSGDERLTAGKVTALNLSEQVPGAGTLQIIQVAGKTYAKLPGGLNTSGKPYVLVTTSSTNPTVKSLAATLQSTQSSASVGNAGVFASAASSITDRGPATVSGAPATHYSVVVDTSKLPSDYPGRDALVQAGVRTLPVELYIDGKNRPVKVTDSLTVSGTSATSEFTVSRYNEPVTISAPPASQVSTS